MTQLDRNFRYMPRILTMIGGICWVVLMCGCFQGFEDHSRFDIKPPILSHAMAGNLSGVKTHIESGGDVNVADRMGNTPLMLAVIDDHVDVVKYLLSNGADPKRKNKVGETALDIAERGAPKRVTKMLQEAAR